MSAPPSLERAIALRGVATLAFTLLVLGIATAALLHVRDGAALDRALLVAAHGGASEGGWTLDHAPPPIETRLVGVDDAEPPPDELVQRALTSERPVYFDRDGRRGVLLVVERERRGREEHRLVEATARRPGPMVTTGPFLLVYVPLAVAATAMAGLGFRWLVRSSMAPLDRARSEASAIETLSSAARLTVQGPEEVRALVASINALLERLERAHQAQDRFTAEAAHELRTPLTTMSLAVDLALRHPRTVDEYREALGSVREELDRLERLVQGLVILARLDGGHEPEPRVIGARALVDEAVSAERAEVELAVGEERLVVRPELASIALRNLLRNARRHAPDSAVTIRTRTVGDLVRIEVDDRGPGVAEEDRERVFDRMTRTGEARRRDPDGLGLGLPIAREIARREGGSCTLEEAPGGGCRAVLALPAA
ncbi:MAG: HAMP domain-containing protein [Alphaproteobacteria bacterium]|nr:HAMP domain-containing protein [Alphaproteobacteria bacterium]MCB9695485.1 HAMP domain-containing protein [Alphaproteobacteria bacterium]